MQELLNEYESGFDIKVGSEIEGEVISITDRVAYVDIHTNTEAQIYINYYTKDPNVQSFKDTNLKVGDIIKAKVTKVSREGSKESTLILLSCLDKLNDEIVDELKNKFDNNETIKVLVTKESEKIYEVSYKGIKGFMPKSLASKNLEINKEIDVKILSLEVNGKRINLKVSERAILDLEYKKNRDLELSKVNEGDVLTGEVIKIEPYGAILKFNYLTGLMKTNQYSHKFVKLNDAIKIGDKLDVKVIKKENDKIELSHKALVESPFAKYIKNHKVADTVKGVLAEKFPFGFVIKLDEDVTGLLHKTEFSFNPNDNYQNNVNVGDEIEVSIIKIDEANEKISLSRKPLLDNPWERVDCKVNDVTTVTVSEINDKGLIVVAYGVDAFIPLSEVCENINEAKDKYQVGDKVDAIVLQVNPKRWQLKMSILKLAKAKEKEEIDKLLENNDVEESTLGDQFKDILK